MLPFILNGYFIYPNKMEGKYKRVTFVEIVFFFVDFIAFVLSW